jgi:hypothetical protein
LPSVAHDLTGSLDCLGVPIPAKVADLRFVTVDPVYERSEQLDEILLGEALWCFHGGIRW